MVELVVLHEQFQVVTLVVALVWLTHEQLLEQLVTLTKVITHDGEGGLMVVLVGLLELVRTREVTQQL